MATKKDVIEKTDERINDICEHMKADIKHLLNSGAVDIDSYEDNWLLPKILVTAAMHRAKDECNIGRASAVRNAIVKHFEKELKNLIVI